MDFLNSYFIWALAAVGLPVLIHLLTRDRVRKVAFSTLRFFIKTSRSVLRRKRFQELLLLILRMAVCALAVLAFSRPFLKADQPAAGALTNAERATVIVMDVSASMSRPGMLEAMKKEAHSVVSSLSQGPDAAAMIVFDESARTKVAPKTSFDQIGKEIDALEPTARGTNISEALRAADAMLRTINARSKEVVLISDLQSAGWRDYHGDWKMAEDVGVTIRPITCQGASNELAIVESEAPQNLVSDDQTQAITVRIANYSDQDRDNVKVILKLAGKEVSAQTVTIRKATTAGPSRAVVTFRQSFATPGDNPGLVQIVPPAGSDTFDRNNFFYFNARVIPRMKVVILSGNPTGDLATDSGMFLASAIQPTKQSAFDTLLLDAAKATPDQLASAQVVILSNVNRVAGPVRDAVAAVLQRGGGVLFMPGSKCTAPEFNGCFEGIAPCELSSVRTGVPAGGLAAGALISWQDFNHPIFEEYQNGRYNFGTSDFYQYWELRKVEGARVSARFDDNRPAVVERAVGGGISMLVSSAADLTWNDFPYHGATFLPFMHKAVRYLAVRSERKTQYRVGAGVPDLNGMRLRDPAGNEHDAKEAPAFFVEGLWTAVNAADGKSDMCFGVNLDANEADPSVKSSDEVVAALHKASGDVVEGVKDAGKGPSAQEKKDEGRIWWYLLAGLSALLVVELFVGNRTLRH